MENPVGLVQDYYRAFFSKDWRKLWRLVDLGVVHDFNGTSFYSGAKELQDFLETKCAHYDEHCTGLSVRVGECPGHVVAEMTIQGRYVKTYGSLPSAHGQPYTLRVKACFNIESGRITRISTVFDFDEWLRQIA